MIAAASDEIATLFVGEMGIKSVQIGEETIYTRPGGYLYIELETEREQR